MNTYEQRLPRQTADRQLDTHYAAIRADATRDVMRVVLAYDASECAVSALEDLSRSGLPEHVHLMLVTASAEEFRAGGTLQVVDAPAEADVEEVPRTVIESIRRMQMDAAMHIRRFHPGWDIHYSIYTGMPDRGVLAAVEHWQADLIVLGSHRRSTFGRMVLGSTSNHVLEHAQCSTRIVRPHVSVPGSPARVLIGIDGTADSLLAVDAVIARRWPRGTSVSVVAARQPTALALPPPNGYDQAAWTRQVLREREWLRNVGEDAARRIRAAGLLAGFRDAEGAPVPVILAEAAEWGADCIFIGARSHHSLERLLHGSVSAAIASHARCTVEVVRS
jgi:nucleotide-binding universal stress UspA family protein